MLHPLCVVPSQIKDLTDLHLPGKRHLVTCVAEGVPTPTIQWYSCDSMLKYAPTHSSLNCHTVNTRGLTIHTNPFLLSNSCACAALTSRQAAASQVNPPADLVLGMQVQQPDSGLAAADARAGGTEHPNQRGLQRDSENQSGPQPGDLPQAPAGHSALWDQQPGRPRRQEGHQAGVRQYVSYEECPVSVVFKLPDERARPCFTACWFIFSVSLFSILCQISLRCYVQWTAV